MFCRKTGGEEANSFPVFEGVMLEIGNDELGLELTPFVRPNDKTKLY